MESSFAWYALKTVFALKCRVYISNRPWNMVLDFPISLWIPQATASLWSFLHDVLSLQCYLFAEESSDLFVSYPMYEPSSILSCIWNAFKSGLFSTTYSIIFKAIPLWRLNYYTEIDSYLALQSVLDLLQFMANKAAVLFSGKARS